MIKSCERMVAGFVKEGNFLQRGQRVLIAAHGNSLRAMVKYLDNMTDEAIMGLNIPTGKLHHESQYSHR